METPVNTTLRMGWVWREKEAGEGRRGFLLPSFAACVLSIDAQRTNHAKQQKSHSASQALNIGHSVNLSSSRAGGGQGMAIARKRREPSATLTRRGSACR